MANMIPAGRTGVLGAWGWEIASLVAAAAMAAAIVTVLAVFDGEQLPKWPLGINLTALISLLTLGLRTALVLVATSVIGQLKWTWFSDAPRPLANFQTFDEASRGLTGSLKLVHLLRLGWRGSPLAVVAAVTAVVSLAIGPFTQQAIQTTPCLRATAAQAARVPVAHEIPGGDGSLILRTATEWSGIGPKAQVAVLSGLINPRGNDSAIQPNCPTGNCTFPETLGVPHSTIGFCSKCLETTSLLRSRGPNLDDAAIGVKNVSLDDITLQIHPPRSMLLSAGTHSNLSFADSIMTPEFKDVAQHAVSNLSVLSWSPLAGEKCGQGSFYNPTCIIATTCTLYFCRKDIAVNVVNGLLQETITKTAPAQRNSVATLDIAGTGRGYTVLKSPCQVDGKLYDTTNFSLIPVDSPTSELAPVLVHGREANVSSHCVFIVSSGYFGGFNVFFKGFFSGECSQGLRGDAVACGESWWLGRFFHKHQASFNNTNTAFHDMATALTNFFRVDGRGPKHNETAYSESKDPSLFKAFIQGEAYESTICLRFAWPWLLLPGILCLTTVLLLLGTLFLGARSNHPAWKSSTLPLLFHGHDAEGPDESSAKDLACLDRRAKNATARVDFESDLSSVIMVDTDESKTASNTETTGGYGPLQGQIS